MANTYKFVYRRLGKVLNFWRTEVVVGHHYEAAQNKMVLFFANGSVRELANWTGCELRLGTDWVLAQKQVMEEKAGQPITLAAGRGN